MAAAVDELDADDELRVGVLTGAGGTFCAGMDLKAFLSGDAAGRSRAAGSAGLTQAPPRKPLIAAVEGWALAGGLRAGARLRPGGRRRDRAVRRARGEAGLVAGAGAALLLARRIPQALALELLLTGEPISAAARRRASASSTG